MKYYIVHNVDPYFSPCDYSAEFIGELIAKSPEGRQFTIKVNKSDVEESQLCTVIVTSIPSFDVEFNLNDGIKSINGYVSRLSITPMLKEIESVVKGEKLEYLDLYDS